ncbi:MAG TPA: hypothetical protein VKR06_37080 [Ktedonosporobacter sp.]|nr:hypothetical protein [Ktedonosporobacter sp.]
MKPLTLSQRIRAAYRRRPQASAQEIRRTVGCEDTRLFWGELVVVQRGLRGFTTSVRKNHNAHLPRNAE